MPIVVRTIAEVRQQIAVWKQQGARIGLVPTMGYLHKGHTSLLDQAKRDGQRAAVSIFVNPAQFGPTEDLASYPRDLERDLQLCRSHGADMVFCPEADEMYPHGFCTSVRVAGVSEGLCGKSRPAHFQGVCTVVAKLLQIFMPDTAYFGRKDAQQLAVIKRMCLDLHMPVRIVGCPTVREADGLAMSSRNAYLTPEERRAAPVIRQSLEWAREAICRGELQSGPLLEAIRRRIEAEPLAKVDYVEIVHPESMRPLERIEGPALLAAAVYFGKARLIDNVLLV